MTVEPIAIIHAIVVPDIGHRGQPIIAQTKPMVETSIHWAVGIVRPQVPFPKDCRLVSRGLKKLRHDHFIASQIVALGVGAGDTCSIRHPPRHQSGACRRAKRVHMKIAKLDTRFRQLIHVGRFDHRIAMATHVGITLIIRHHQNDIGLVRPRNGAHRNMAGKQQKKKRTRRSAVWRPRILC